MVEYSVYMNCGGHTGDVEIHKEFENVIKAESKDNAFEKWIKINKLEKGRFTKIGDGRWSDYYVVHVKEII